MKFGQIKCSSGKVEDVVYYGEGCYSLIEFFEKTCELLSSSDLAAILENCHNIKEEE